MLQSDLEGSLMENGIIEKYDEYLLAALKNNNEGSEIAALIEKSSQRCLYGEPFSQAGAAASSQS